MSQAKHSMIPWYFDDSTGCVYSESGLRIADPYCEGQESEMSDEVVEANARFIVRACNSHEGLLEACKDLFECSHTNADPMHKHWIERCKAKARAEIARAEGGAL